MDVTFTTYDWVNAGLSDDDQNSDHDDGCNDYSNNHNEDTFALVAAATPANKC